jgi:hypothetical protein
MATAYRAYHSSRFASCNPYIIPRQSNFVDFEIPNTSVSQKQSLGLIDFSSYDVHHELIIEQFGRVKNVTFMSYATPFDFNMHYSKSNNLVFINTNKKVCNSLIYDLVQTNDFEVEALSVDFDVLIPHITQVKGAWFKFRNPNLRASAVFGNHVDKSPAYQEALNLGEMSSMYILYDFQGQSLQVQITSDCAIVLYANIPDIAMELKIIFEIYEMLKSTKTILIPVKKAKGVGQSSPSVEQKTESLGSLFEVLEENGL